MTRDKVIEIIRFEHPEDGCGFWNSKYKNNKFRINSHSNYVEIGERHRSEEFPSFLRDFYLQRDILNMMCDPDEVIDNYRFAFNSIDGFKYALTMDEIKEFINNLGFKVYLIKTDDYFTSSYQSMFNPKNIIEKREITTLFL